MVSNLVFYQLALIALVWVFLMLSWCWPSEPAAARPIPPTPVTPPRKRSTAPKPFTGLARKPHCDACEPAIEGLRLPLPSVPPPRLVSTRGRRRHVDTSRHCCPDADCRYGGWLGLGNISANGHPSGGPWRQLYCSHCQGYFLETHGTIFHGKRVSVERIVHVIGCLAEGLGVRGTARVFEVDPNTVLQWLVEAADQLQGFSRHVLHDVRVQQVQLDELFALLSAVKDGEVSKAEALERLERSLMVKKLIWSSPGGSASRMAVLCLMQQRPDPRPVQPETDHRERAKRDQDFHPTSTEPPSRRHLRLLHPAHHIEHKAYTQDKPCPIVCRVRVRPQQRGFFRCRASRNRAPPQVAKPCSDIAHIKNQKDQHGQDHMPPRPPPEAQDFPQGEQHSETTEQPHPCRLDRLLTLVPRPVHVTSYAVGET